MRVTCTECEHEVQCFGQTDASVRRCFVMLRDDCPEGRTDNFYVDENEE